MSKSTEARLKNIDRVIAFYKAQRLRIKAQEIQQDNIDEGKRRDLTTRMVQGYNKNRDQIKQRPKQPELSQSAQRKRKLADLISRTSSWRGLR